MSQKYFELTSEEQELLKAFETGKLKSIENLSDQKKLYQKYAENTLEKTKNINLRLSQKTVLKLKARAVSEGIPYQTLASSILHKYVNQ